VFANGLEFVPLFHFLSPPVCSQTQTNLRQSKQSAFPLVQLEEMGTERIKKKNLDRKTASRASWASEFMWAVVQTLAVGVKNCPFPPEIRGGLIWCHWNDPYPSITSNQRGLG